MMSGGLISFFGVQLQKIMGSGQLLPDEIIFRLLSKRLETGVSEGETGFILDGFPRTVHQAVSTMLSILISLACHVPI